jgi:hypothetical protein
MKKRLTRQNNPVVGRVTLAVCIPQETALMIRDLSRIERVSMSRVASETLVAVFGGPKGVKS